MKKLIPLIAAVLAFSGCATAQTVPLNNPSLFGQVTLNSGSFFTGNLAFNGTYTIQSSAGLNLEAFVGDLDLQAVSGNLNLGASGTVNLNTNVSVASGKTIQGVAQLLLQGSTSAVFEAIAGNATVEAPGGLLELEGASGIVANNVFKPNADNSVDLGATGVRFANLYVNSINFGVSGSLAGILTSGTPSNYTISLLGTGTGGVGIGNATASIGAGGTSGTTIALHAGSGNAISVGGGNESQILYGGTLIPINGVGGSADIGSATAPVSTMHAYHIAGEGNSGIFTITPGTAAGTGATYSITGNDTSGTLTVTTGTGPTAGLWASIVFLHGYSTIPRVIWGEIAGNAQNLGAPAATESTTQFSLWVTGSPAASTAYTYNWICIQ